MTGNSMRDLLGDAFSPRQTSRSLGAILMVSLLAFAGCATQSSLAEADQRVITQLTEIAPQDSEIDGQTTRVECWKPSENLLDEVKFRVICRVHYDQKGTDRYRDMICIGDTSEDPVTDHCYRWAFYTDMPKFEDQAGYAAG